MKKLLFFVVFVWTLSLSSSIFAQTDLPKEIRGYKVHQAKISVKNQAEKSGGKSAKNVGMEAFIEVSEPEVAEINLTGITFELTADIEVSEQSGTIDFLMFRDFRVNDLAVQVEEYTSSFEVKKNDFISLPKPIKIFVGARQTLRGAWSEALESKEEWTVTGRIFVFGKFKKAGFKFKRVIPVDINLKIKNPVKSRLKVESKNPEIIYFRNLNCLRI